MHTGVETYDTLGRGCKRLPKHFILHALCSSHLISSLDGAVFLAVAVFCFLYLWGTDMLFFVLVVSHRFTMPGPAEDPMGDSPWYGFDFGPIHFTVMSTEHDFSPGSTQVHLIRSSGV